MIFASESRGDARGNASIRRAKDESEAIHQGYACARNRELI